MTKVNPLLAVMNPRQITVVLDSLKEITKYDKLYVTNYRSKIANGIGKQYFLDHEEYTHYVRVSDDIIISQSHVDALVKDIEENPHIEVIGCPCNANVSEEGLKMYGICTNLPSKKRIGRQYNRILIKDAPKSGIYTVEHQGAALEFISRRLLENEIVTLEPDLTAEITLVENDDYINYRHSLFGKRSNTRRYYSPSFIADRFGCCIDVVVSHQLKESGIKQYVDFGWPIKHLKLPAGSDQNLLVGKKPEKVTFVPRTF